MTDKIKVRWEADDGYCGGSRPQLFTVEADDFSGCETDAEISERLGEITQEEFDNRVSWSLRNEAEVIEKIRAELAKASP